MDLRRLAARRLTQLEVKAKIDDIVGLICDAHPVNQIILFGSAARGEMTEASDLDVIVIIENNENVSMVEKKIFLHPKWGKWPADLLVYPLSEYNRKANIGGVPYLSKTEGIVVYSK